VSCVCFRKHCEGVGHGFIATTIAIKYLDTNFLKTIDREYNNRLVKLENVGR
jgi:hypothetical protein